MSIALLMNHAEHLRPPPSPHHFRIYHLLKLEQCASLRDDVRCTMTMCILFASLQVPDPNKGTEYLRGFVMRKCCVEPDGRKSKSNIVLRRAGRTQE